MRRTSVIALALLCLATVAGPAGAQSETTTVTLVHGFRGLLADIYLDGERILQGFAPARSTDPTELPSGSHDVAVREADAPADSTPLLEVTVDLPPGANVSAVVHPDTDGEPTLSVFDNAIDAPGGDQARAVVRHTAVAPAIDVRFDDRTVVEGLQAGDEGRGTVPAGAAEVTTSAADSGSQLLAPARVSADPNVVVALYLIGSADDDSLGWLSQRLGSGAGTTPLGVPTGNSGLADAWQLPWWAWFAAAAAALTAARAVRVARATA